MTLHKHDINAKEHRFSNRVLQVFARSGLPPVLEVKAATATQPAEILLYNEIGMFGITAKSFASALAEAGEGDLTLRINSPGGDVFDAMAIYNMLNARKTPVTCVVDGLAASAASLIAMSGKTVMQEHSMMMIHNSHTVALGDRHAMTETADILAKVDGTLAKIYAHRSKTTQEEAHAVMDKETWLTATEALAQNYCDEVAEAHQTDAVAALASLAIQAAASPDSTSCMDCIDNINDAIGSLSEAIDCLMPVDPDETDDQTMQMQAAKELRLRQLRLISSAN